jgi:hypothetical protein
MSRTPQNPGSWPRLMRAATAASYCDERSVQSFLRSVGEIYPGPIKVSGKGDRWLREDLDRALDSLSGSPATIRDAADVL